MTSLCINDTLIPSGCVTDCLQAGVTDSVVEAWQASLDLTVDRPLAIEFLLYGNSGNSRSKKLGELAVKTDSEIAAMILRVACKEYDKCPNADGTPFFFILE